MRCPWYLCHRLFCIWARTQGPHDPLLLGGPMSFQSAPGAVISLIQLIHLHQNRNELFL
ncbi:unnamed protein product [Staurois parvus]|uniref:Uncharacterized protein n=1 Tax=Staurois parvus TaxID=386267 RepID=A0ABN9GCT0_9NEOB|nr:unnamed protein product [Staurois parvus]